jgi:hypothetical protein
VLAAARVHAHLRVVHDDRRLLPGAFLTGVARNLMPLALTSPSRSR